jgi:hypothetical protein
MKACRPSDNFEVNRVEEGAGLIPASGGCAYRRNEKSISDERESRRLYGNRIAEARKDLRGIRRVVKESEMNRRIIVWQPHRLTTHSTGASVSLSFIPKLEPLMQSFPLA